MSPARDIEVAAQSATKVALSCATKIACVNGRQELRRTPVTRKTLSEVNDMYIYLLTFVLFCTGRSLLLFSSFLPLLFQRCFKRTLLHVTTVILTVFLRGGAVALWLVLWTPDRTIRVRASAGELRWFVFLGKTLNSQAPFTQTIFVAQLDAIFVALWVASSFKHVRNLGVIAATKSQVVYTGDFVVAIQSATKIASSCATKIACVNGASQCLSSPRCINGYQRNYCRG